MAIVRSNRDRHGYLVGVADAQPLDKFSVAMGGR
jgi:hypothetical protein